MVAGLTRISPMSTMGALSRNTWVILWVVRCNVYSHTLFSCTFGRNSVYLPVHILYDLNHKYYNPKLTEKRLKVEVDFPIWTALKDCYGTLNTMPKASSSSKQSILSQRHTARQRVSIRAVLHELFPCSIFASHVGLRRKFWRPVGWSPNIRRENLSLVLLKGEQENKPCLYQAFGFNSICWALIINQKQSLYMFKPEKSALFNTECISIYKCLRSSWYTN